MKTHSSPPSPFITFAILTIFFYAVSDTAADSASDKTAEEILKKTGIQGGVIVHLGCGDGRLTASLRVSDHYVVHGLDRDAGNVNQARQQIRSQNLYGGVSIDRLHGNRLPYIDNLVNLIVAENWEGISRKEMLRVLCPEGVATIKQDQRWIKVTKPRPEEIDEWTHYLHDASGNPVAHDTAIGPPRRLQWVGSPRWTRHHDHMSSMSALVSSGGRIVYIMDEGSAASIELPAKWKLIARDAFNGKILWKRNIDKWHTHLWPLKSGPAQLPRRLIAQDDTVYVTLAIDAPVTALDAVTGKTLRTYKGTDATEEIVLSDGILFALIDPNPVEKKYERLQQIRRGYGAPFWNEKPRQLKAVQANTGETLWTVESKILPMTLAVNGQHVYFHNGDRVVCLDRIKGDESWHSNPIPRSEQIKSFYAPILIAYKDVVLFSGGERAGMQGGEWYTSGIDTMTALSAKDGKTLWQADHPPSGYRSPEDLFVINDLVWTGETTSGRVMGLFRGRNYRNGEVKREFVPDVDTYWFHHRCYRGKATDRYILTSRTGTEFIDPETKHWQIHHWVRGACLYGIMPANGLIYAPPSPCACYLESRQSDFNALASGKRTQESLTKISNTERLEKGPAYHDIPKPKFEGSKEWPTLRHDSARSGFTKATVSSDLKPLWDRDIGGKLTSVVVAEGKLFVASVEDHTVHALDAETGNPIWQYTAGGRVDSPPTIHEGRVLFGSADGWVYCLRASDGALAWRFLAAPLDQRLISYEQIESVWPVHGSVLIQNDALYLTSGRSMFVDGGLRFWRLDPKTGGVLSETVLDDRVQETGKDLQDYISWLNMPTALPDILSSDGNRVYMRSQPFNLDGTRLPLKAFPRAEDPDKGAPAATQDREFAHIFSPTGFLDDTWWHRTYWLYGSTFVSGWCGYYLAGKSAPAGRLLVHDDSNVYGFGRKQKYYRWTTPIEYQLFSASRSPKSTTDTDRKGNPNQVSQIDFKWASTLPLLVQAMVLADRTLFVAGPSDLVDEEAVLKRLSDPAILTKLKEQDAAWKGEKGGSLWAVSIENGKRLAEYPLDSIPVWDGMAVTNGRVYMATVDGKIVCFKEASP